ncbi:hypothetical protein [Candidatus Nephthysia bennettiae]|uniref:Integral membrane protein n=1 Tax=Candidatus Nephthysia bennettiae TaxID=3127016 RepID=A0A934KBU9_9BACT|nr:hypothetical protein [Candidatus Dormibacteraeota bacterium]
MSMDIYSSTVELATRTPLFWMLVAMLVTFLATRVVTRRIRAGGPGLGNWTIRGVHVHHQVFGVIAMLVSGGLEFAYRPGPVWSSPLAALFGFGASLTLDEFALWLHLDDVYWSPQGRKSIDAVFIAVLITGLLMVGFTRLDLSGPRHELLAYLAAGFVINLVLSVTCLFKGKPVLGLVGLLVPSIAFVGALRLAKPRSQWAAWRYSADSHKLLRAERRFDAAYEARWNRIRDLIGGAPDL